jgi:hypothetical protein
MSSARQALRDICSRSAMRASPPPPGTATKSGTAEPISDQCFSGQTALSQDPYLALLLPRPSNAVAGDEPAHDAQSLPPLVRSYLQALFKPLDRAAVVYGRTLLTKDLQMLHRRAVAVLGP